MAVTERLVDAERPAAVGVVAAERRRRARLGGTHADLDAHVPEDSRSGEGVEAEDGAGGVAPHAARERGSLQLRAVQLRKPVDSALQKLRMTGGRAVPLLVVRRALQADVPGKVGHLDPAVEILFYQRLGGPVRKRQEGDVRLALQSLFRRAERQLGKRRPQMRVRMPDRLPLFASRHRAHRLDGRMRRQNPEDFASRHAACSPDNRSIHRLHPFRINSAPRGTRRAPRAAPRYRRP